FVLVLMGITRNFLRENRMMVSQATPNYQMPTLASTARCYEPVRLVLAETQRRLTGGAVAKRSIPVRRKLSEKQSQTEDISDERFLNAALLKCSEKSQSQLQSRSEGDDPVFPGEGLPLRRTASNFELGRVPDQRDGYQPGQYTLHRPLVSALGILPSRLDNSCSSIQNQDDETSLSSGTSTPSVRQMDIPEMVDVDPEDVLSVHSQESCEKLPIVEDQPRELEVQLQPELEKQSDTQHILLSSEQRRELLDAAHKQKNQLIAEYNRLPLSMGTLRVRNLKRKLEQQLDVVDHDLSMLLLEKVYLKQENNCATLAYQKV
ncbi:hypothetical protein KR084_001434, partial [Drosophila pseudotakahashii]